MLKMTNCGAIGCVNGFIIGSDVNAELDNTVAIDCQNGFLMAGNEKELALLLEKVKGKPEELNQLVKNYQAAEPEKKQEAISQSVLFEYLSAFASATTVYQFLESAIQSLLK